MNQWFHDSERMQGGGGVAGLFGLRRLFHRQDELAEPAFQAMHMQCAYVCQSCKFIIDGAHRGQCKRCGSSQIFHLQSVLDRVRNPIHERLQGRQEFARPDAF